MKNFLAFVFGALGALLVWIVWIAFIIPQYSEYRAHACITRWMGELKQIQPNIETQLKSRDFDFSSVTLPKLSNAHEVFINTDGSIIVKGNEEAYDSLLILTPQLDADGVSWRCFASEKIAGC